MTEPGPPALLGVRGVLLALLAAVLLCWPMLLVTAPLGYFDTGQYLDEGQGIVERLLPPPAPEAAPAQASESGAAAEPIADEAPQSLRPLLYAAFLYATSRTPLGLVLSTVLQTTATLLLLLPFLPDGDRVRRWAVAPAILLCGGFTTLPWFASYAMPDILGAGVLLYYLLLVDRFDRLPGAWKLLTVALGSFAVASHYGNLPLAALLLAGMLGLRALARRRLWRAAALGILPLLLTSAVNVTGSVVAFGEASVAPKRLPLLLARSIDDGPGALFLRERCADPVPAYEICRAFGGHVPEDIWSFLWSDHGIESLSDAQLDAIREEEPRLLWDIFRAYPAAQARALFGNAATQVVLVGTGEVQPLVVEHGPKGLRVSTTTEAAEADPALRLFDGLVKIGTGAGAVLFVLALATDRRRASWETAALLLLGLLANAAIFGGLSAPVDRYQSRLAWLVPALACAALARRPLRRPQAEGALSPAR